MNREELKALGLTDEQIDKVMASHGKTLNDVKAKADKLMVLRVKLMITSNRLPIVTNSLLILVIR
ncbi:hypothetical protein [Halalkalibacter hemicellulosilyticus]|uniref:Uncharacterized protein n=1 Tax=Halalkalibacter hemicellulosilyticusJCM 9152 TaxID=1236971 RepID=W4QM96_9BACI|nr:hypothetical protein [Halalkalibacter hemicellulosilyticus]GAE32439.1 hypothetical protein JCM9152_3974 [Halalkalibacter hemicellulosilyticusJCM 9152]